VPGEHLSYPEIHAVWGTAILVYDTILWPWQFGAAEMWRP
jgi:hypothetical protein